MRVSVGQTSGATQRCRILDSAAELPIRTHTHRRDDAHDGDLSRAANAGWLGSSTSGADRAEEGREPVGSSAAELGAAGRHHEPVMMSAADVEQRKVRHQAGQAP